MKAFLAAIIICLGLILVSDSSYAALVPPSDVTVTLSYGSYNNSLSNISDGVYPEEWSGWTESLSTWWYGNETYFILDLGKAYNLEAISASLDNNDYYRIDWSLDGNNWDVLSIVSAYDGNVGWGMDTFGVGEISIPLNCQARYLGICAIGGDGMYSIGELNAYGSTGSAVPEPATMALFGIGTAVMAFARRKRS